MHVCEEEYPVGGGTRLWREREGEVGGREGRGKEEEIEGRRITAMNRRYHTISCIKKKNTLFADLTFGGGTGLTGGLFPGMVTFHSWSQGL